MCYGDNVAYAQELKWVPNGAGYKTHQCSFRFENDYSFGGGIQVADGSSRFVNHGGGSHGMYVTPGK